MKSTLILVNGYGQNCNRLIQNYRLLCFCKANNVRFINFSLWRWYSKYYPGAKVPLFQKIFALVCKGIFRVLDLLKIDIIYHLDDKTKVVEYRKHILSHRLTLVDHWHLYDTEGEKQYGEEIRQSFQLLPEWYRNDPDYQALKKFKDDGCTLIGVHIRRGDYKEFHNGEWYYSDDVYEKYIEQFREFLPDTPKKFIIFSVEKTTIAGDDIYCTHAPWYVDLHCLGMCDYTFGPPSTFRQWASFMSGKLSWDIRDPNREIPDIKALYPYHSILFIEDYFY